MPEASTGVFAKVAKPLDEQVEATRFCNRLYRYVGNKSFRELAEHGGRYLTSPAILDEPRALPGVMLADYELGREPTHITIVGSKSDPRSSVLYAAARRLPAPYERLEWWDRGEGPLPNADVEYPEFDQPAAFTCSDRICSLPVFDPADLNDVISRMRKASRN
jgi:uncharacterized protein YyaL (SSP411 family)